MEAKKVFSLCWDVGGCLQKIKFLVETGRATEAKKLLPVLTGLREQARELGIGVEFSERRAYVRLPHPEYPGHKPRAVLVTSFGGWFNEDAPDQGHAHVIIEFIVDGTCSGGPQVIPGDIIVEVEALLLDGGQLPWHDEADDHPDSNLGRGRLFSITNITEGT